MLRSMYVKVVYTFKIIFTEILNAGFKHSKFKLFIECFFLLSLLVQKRKKSLQRYPTQIQTNGWKWRKRKRFMCLPINNFVLYPSKKYFHQFTFMDNQTWIMSRGVIMIYLCNDRKIYFLPPSLFSSIFQRACEVRVWIYPPPPGNATNCVCLYIFFTQIWFSECN